MLNLFDQHPVYIKDELRARERVAKEISILRHVWTAMVFLALMVSPSALLQAQDGCSALLREMELPGQLDTEGKPVRAKWEKVDRVLSTLREETAGADCRFTFETLFKTNKDEVYIPLTNNLVRTVPEESLQGLPVFDQSGRQVGQFVGRVAYNRSGGLYARNSYTLYYFQYKDNAGQLQSSGNRLLLDDYLVRWGDVKERLAIESAEHASR